MLLVGVTAGAVEGSAPYVWVARPTVNIAVPLAGELIGSAPATGIARKVCVPEVWMHSQYKVPATRFCEVANDFTPAAAQLKSPDPAMSAFGVPLAFDE